MIRLLKIETRKLAPYSTTWVLIGLHFLLAWLVMSAIESLIINIEINGARVQDYGFTSIPVLHFPDIWHNISYVASLFKVILAILVIISICNEFTYRTMRQNIMDGLSRWEFVCSKLLFIGFISFAATLLLFFFGIIMGRAGTPEESTATVMQQTGFLVAYFFQLLGYLTFALLVGLVIKRSGLSIALLILYSLIIEPILGYMLPQSAAPYLPLRTLKDLIPFPFSKYLGAIVQESISLTGIGLAFLYILLFSALVLLLLRKRDL